MTEMELCLWRLGLLEQTQYLAQRRNMSVDNVVTELVLEKFFKEYSEELDTIYGEEGE